MKQIIDEYGAVLLEVIIACLCIIMYVHVWFGSAGESYDKSSMLSEAAHDIFSGKKGDNANLHDATRKSTSSSDGFHTALTVKNPDGTSYTISDKTVTMTQDKTASTAQNIADRYNPKLFSYGTQNQKNANSKENQLLVNTPYATTDLFYAVEYNKNGVKTGEIHATSKDKNASGSFSDDKHGQNGYMRVLSISTAKGDELISNCSKINRKSIAFANETYTNKKGASGSTSYITQTGFTINTPDGSSWFNFDVTNQNWCFYKAGTYCFRVFVCDSYGKSAINTVYISVASSITRNEGSGTAGAHD